MPNYMTPGVYVEEISTFPSSVVRVATAVPVFVGYTGLSSPATKNRAIKIRSFAEFESMFGGEPTTEGRTIVVTIDSNGRATNVELSLKYYLYHSVRHYYANGGGDAYILSVGDYTSTGPVRTELETGIGYLSEYDEPTLVVVPDAFALTAIEMGKVQAAVLAHCNAMQDRFGIFDVKHNPAGNGAFDDASALRTNIGNQFLKNGAAYYPELVTSLGPTGEIAVGSFTLQNSLGAPLTLTDLGTASADPLLIAYNKAVADRDMLDSLVDRDALQADYDAIVIPDPVPASTLADFEAELGDRVSAIVAAMYAAYNLGAPGTFQTQTMKDAVEDLIDGSGLLKLKARTLYEYVDGFRLVPGATGPLSGMGAGDFDGSGAVTYDYDLTGVAALPSIYGLSPADAEAAANNSRATFDALMATVMGYLDSLFTLANNSIPTIDLFENTTVLAEIRQAIRNAGYTLPPSGAVTGVYASVDANRGVWKAPANVSLNGVRSVRKLRNDELDELNVSVGTGKSINAIRFFRGQGNLVYGARTLAGNDNEWRYVPVRRLFIMAEESIRKATEPFVFEPNDANTWIKVKGMIENFLLGLWRDGALAGAVPQDAFFVKVGIGQTMTAEDILNGRMIVEIGMAAVRPAEFVVLRFSHMMQAS